MDRWHALAERDQLEPRSHVAAPSLEPEGNVYQLAAWRMARA